jgi:exopolysaccharide production protein ExoZ
LTRVSTKINNLQAVRAFAALAVVFFHTGFVFPGVHPFGSAGVDIFFALSGYIMARICEKDPSFFLRRRIIRIIPPYWVLTVLLFLAAKAVPDLMGSTTASIAELFKSLFFIPFIKDHGIIRPVLFVGWSLNYEMFFYVAIALSLFLVRKRALLLASAIILGLHFIAFAFPFHNAMLQFLRADYILEFPLGALAYYAARAVSEERARSWRVASALLMAAAVTGLSLMQLYRPVFHPIILRDLLSASAGTLIVFSASLLSQGGWDTRFAPLVLLGDASYVLYLVHPYCEYTLQRAIVPHLPALRIDAPLGCIVAIAASVAVALLLHLYAELPALAFLNRRFGGRRSAEFRVRMETKGQVNP